MLGKQIQRLREARNLTQVQLAGALNVSKQSVSNWENDNILPSIEMLMKVAGFFSVSTDLLLGLDERRFVEVSGLSETEIAHVQQIVEDIKKREAVNRKDADG